MEHRFGAASDDFDLFIARSSDFAILAASAEFQTGTQDPLEATGFTNATASPVTVFIAVSEFHLVSPPASLILDYFAIRDCNLQLQYVTPSDSLIGPPGAFADGSVGPTDLTALVLDALQASP